MANETELEIEIQRMKSFAESLRRTQAVFSNTFKTLSAKDRARTIQKIQSDIRILSSFITRVRSQKNNNTGTKFSIENLNETLNTLKNLWRKTQMTLESYSRTSGTSKPYNEKEEVNQAVKNYASMLRALGHDPSFEQIDEFRKKLEPALHSAREQSDGSELSIKLENEDGRIKVKLIPR